jgi:hypothetical protein
MDLAFHGRPPMGLAQQATILGKFLLRFELAY